MKEYILTNGDTALVNRGQSTISLRVDNWDFEKGYNVTTEKEFVLYNINNTTIKSALETEENLRQRALKLWYSVGGLMKANYRIIENEDIKINCIKYFDLEPLYYTS